VSGDLEPPFTPRRTHSLIRRRKVGRPLADDLHEIRATFVLLCIALLLLGFSVLLAYRQLPLGFLDRQFCASYGSSGTCQNGLSAIGALTSLLGLVLAASGGVLAGWTAPELHGRARALAWGAAATSVVVVATFVIWAVILEL